jgi:hypothetical protein
MDVTLYHGTSIDPATIRKEGLIKPSAALLRDYVARTYGIQLPPLPAVVPDESLYLTPSKDYAREYALMGGFTLSNLLLNIATRRRLKKSPGYVYTVKVPELWLSERELEWLRSGRLLEVRLSRAIPPERVVAVERV